MAIEIGLLVALIGGAIAILGFHHNLQSVAKHEGATMTEMRKDIEYIVKEVKSIRITLDKRDAKYDDSIRRLHERIDEHIAKCHAQEG